MWSSSVHGCCDEDHEADDDEYGEKAKACPELLGSGGHVLVTFSWLADLLMDQRLVYGCLGNFEGGDSAGDGG